MSLIRNANKKQKLVLGGPASALNSSDSSSNGLDDDQNVDNESIKASEGVDLSSLDNVSEEAANDAPSASSSNENSGFALSDADFSAEGSNDDSKVTIEQIIDESENKAGNDYDPFAINSGKPKKKRKLNVDPRFDANILSIKGGYANLKANLDAYINWCKAHPKETEPLTFLFTGLPGTGKTQLGRHIAEIMHKPLIVKRMSDIMSCYVGESEKNVAQAFEEASDKKGVLMIDEADSLFVSRQAAHTSWEVSLTNEVLSQMEDFESVFICTTNLLNNFDSAAMRRFDWKVAFLPSTPEQRVLLYSAYFNNNKEVSNEVKNVLIDARLNGLCPGDFKAVWRKLRFIDHKTPKEIISSLLTELRYKQKQG